MQFESLIFVDEEAGQRLVWCPESGKCWSQASLPLDVTVNKTFSQLLGS
jgi:hypothetical protein